MLTYFNINYTLLLLQHRIYKQITIIYHSIIRTTTFYGQTVRGHKVSISLLGCPTKPQKSQAEIQHGHCICTCLCTYKQTYKFVSPLLWIVRHAKYHTYLQKKVSRFALLRHDMLNFSK